MERLWWLLFGNALLAEFEGKPVLTWSPPANVKADAPTAVYVSPWLRALQETFQLMMQGMRKTLKQLDGMDVKVLNPISKCCKTNVKKPGCRRSSDG